MTWFSKYSSDKLTNLTSILYINCLISHFILYLWFLDCCPSRWTEGQFYWIFSPFSFCSFSPWTQLLNVSRWVLTLSIRKRLIFLNSRGTNCLLFFSGRLQIYLYYRDLFLVQFIVRVGKMLFILNEINWLLSLTYLMLD